MDPRLLQVYNEELTYLRESAREFGEENEAVAGRLGLKTPTDPDPYVERLLEGVAFLSARVRLKLNDQFPDFTQHLLNAVQPHYVAPTPSICIVGFEPQEGDQAIADGYTIAKGAELSATLPDQPGASVTFTTGHAVTLWPLKIIEAEYLSSRAAVAAVAAAAGVRAEAGLRLRFAGTGGVPLEKIDPGPLPLYIDGSESVPGELYRQVLADSLCVMSRPAESAGGREAWTRLSMPEPHGMDNSCALLPAHARSFPGYRLLSEYFACPERFLFFTLADLGRAFARSTGPCDVYLLFKRSVPTLAGAVSRGTLKPFVTPAINLFEKQLGRVHLKPYEHEFQLIPDRTRPLDFEVHSILEVVAFGKSNTDPRPVAPLYAFGALLYDWRDALFYVPRLRLRRMSTKEQRLRRRTDYVGTETWIAVTSPGNPERLDEIHELGVRALVTNRELPEMLRLGAASDLSSSGAPVRAVTLLRAPTRPRPPLGLEDGAWRVIGHLTPNYASLAAQDGGDPALLRDHLALYGRTDDPVMRRQIDSILSLSSQPVTRRAPGAKAMAFARGLNLRLRLDDAAFENAQMYLFASVLERFLGEFATVNSFTECVFESVREGEFARWPPRAGQRRNI